MLANDDLHLLLSAAEAAGQIAVAHAAGPLEIEDKPDGAGPVTQADLAVNACLEDLLRGARPGYGWLSEESGPDPARLTSEATFVIDPIDGTRSFIEGSRTWAISVAVVRDGVPVAGVVHLPAREITYAAAAGRGATRNGKYVRARSAAPQGRASVLATKPSMQARHWHGIPPEFSRSHRPSLAYRMCLVAEGRFDGMFTFRPSWEWDLAAGAVICAEAGAAVSNGRGGVLRFNNPHPQTDGVIAASRPFHRKLIAQRALAVI